jgi:molecular chaperone DnaK
VFSTAEDNQTAVTVHVLQGEREMARDNKSLGRFDLSDLPPAPRGTPQVEVTFDIDANGILNVSAKDKATGKAQSIIVKASSGLSEDEIKQMIKDAEVHAEEDRKLRQLVDTRNQADNLIHASEKSLAELGEKVSGEERASIESAVRDLKDVLKQDNKDVIEAKARALAEISGKLAERLYAAKNESAAPGAGQQSAGGDGQAQDKKEDVVDAEFEEVKGERK